MLDDLKYIHQRDSKDALGIAEKQWQQLNQEFKVSEIKGDIKNIVFSGMGGSALAAKLSLTWPGYKIPFEISSQYSIPRYVSSETLFIAASYSGNTEETLQSLKLAEEVGAQIAVITSGGELEKIALDKKYPVAKLPGGFQPRYTAFYAYKALMTVLESAKLLEDTDLVQTTLKNGADYLKEVIQDFIPTNKIANNPAKKLARELMGTSPVVYASSLFWPVAYKWKISINENAKNVAWWNQYPEFNHNEFIGWSSHPHSKPYSVIDLRSDLDDERIIKRFQVTEKLLSGRRPMTHSIELNGETVFEQMLYGSVFGDFVSLYLALLNGIDPTPVELIEKLKREIA